MLLFTFIAKATAMLNIVLSAGHKQPRDRFYVSNIKILDQIQQALWKKCQKYGERKKTGTDLGAYFLQSLAFKHVLCWP